MAFRRSRSAVSFGWFISPSFGLSHDVVLGRVDQHLHECECQFLLLVAGNCARWRIEKRQIHLPLELLRWSFHVFPPSHGTSAKHYRSWQDLAKLRVGGAAHRALPRKSAARRMKSAHTPD